MHNPSMFGNTAEQMKQQLELQLAQYSKLEQARQVQNGGLMEELRQTIMNLSQDEQVTLSNFPEFKTAKVLYETGFMEFLSSKYAQEYISTPVGKQAIENLNESAKFSVNKIKELNKEKQLKLEAMAALFEADPEMQKKLQEQMNKQS